MNTQFEQHIVRYSPAGFLGLGKSMQVSSFGQFVKIDDLDKEVLKSKQLTHSLDSARLRERQLDGRVKQLEADFKQSEQSQLDLLAKISEDNKERMKRDLALADFLVIADEIVKKATNGKKGKSLQDKYLEARAKLAR